MQKTLDDLIEVGRELLGVKEAVGHGHFGAWLKAEFGWTERTAQNLMSVAERFGSNPKLISDLPIQPTAAYLLEAPSVPDEARRRPSRRPSRARRSPRRSPRRSSPRPRKRSDPGGGRRCLLLSWACGC